MRVKIAKFLRVPQLVINKRSFRRLLILSVFFFYFFIYQSTSFKVLRHLPPSVDIFEWSKEDVIYSAVKTDSENENRTKDQASAMLRRDELIILHYTKYFGHLDAEPVLHGSRHCSHIKDIIIKESYHERPVVSEKTGLFDIPCRITFDKKYFNESDALVFHSHDLEPGRDELPTGVRDLTKPWIFFNQESPQKTGLDLQLFPNIFNWTMTYRRDSDIYLPYAYILPREEANGETRRANKTGLVAWIVSNCDPPSKRQQLVYQLQKYISVDIFGWCGRECPTVDRSKLDCYKYVAAHYKFYLSFENSLCSDYITEKFFLPLTFEDDILPIVYGGFEFEDYIAVAPSNSFIDASSFDSPKGLAEFLHYLNENETEYRKYFEWKGKYRVIDSHQGFWCHLCQRLYEHLKLPWSSVKWYKDLWQWWSYKEITERSPYIQVVDTTVTTVERRIGKKAISSCADPPEKLTGFYHPPWKDGMTGKLVNWGWKTFIEK